MIRAVIFDLGHTVWDIGPDTTGLLDRAYEELRAELAVTLRRRDVPSAGTLRAAVTAALAADSATYFMDGPELTQPPTHSWLVKGLGQLGLEVEDAAARELTEPLFATEIDRLVVAEGTIEAIHGLRDAGLAIGCVTNTLASQGAIEAMLERHGLLAAMSAVVVSSEEGVRKPHPRLFEIALAATGTGPSEAVFVGDSPYHDIAAAKAIGMRAIRTTQYASRPPVPGTPEPDAVITHLREVLPLIRGW